MMTAMKAALRVALAAALTLPLMPLQFLLLKLWPSAARKLPHVFHQMLCRILGIDIRIHGALPPTVATLIVSNHVSWLDIPVLSTLAALSFVAKREVASWPFFGWLAKLQRTVFVDRERRTSTASSRDELSDRLSARETVVLFPEGTSHDGASLLKFKSSFFAAATSDTSVVPVTLVYARRRGLPLTRRHLPTFAWYGDMDLVPHLWAAICAMPLTVHVFIHDALDETTTADRKKAADIAEATIRAQLAAALHGRVDLR
jgi:1-acyl-sn-glycerol-3-phosphate acyltransferase